MSGTQRVSGIFLKMTWGSVAIQPSRDQEQAGSATLLRTRLGIQWNIGVHGAASYAKASKATGRVLLRVPDCSEAKVGLSDKTLSQKNNLNAMKIGVPNQRWGFIFS